MPMGKIFTLFYLYDNLNDDNLESGKFFDLEFKEFSGVLNYLNRNQIKAPDKIVNKILELSRNNRL